MTPITAALIASGIFASLIPLHYALNKKPKLLKTVTKILLPVYIAALFAFTLTTVSLQPTISIKIAKFGEWFSKDILTNFANIELSDFCINIAMMFPVGYAINANSKNQSFGKSVLKGLALGAVLGLSIEFLQFALPIQRSPSLCDATLNCLSGGIGGAACGFTHFLIKKKEEKNKDLNKPIEHQYEYVSERQRVTELTPSPNVQMSLCKVNKIHKSEGIQEKE